MILGEHNGHKFVLGSMVSARYRSGKTPAQAIVPPDFNPSVNHTNLQETDASSTSMRALGAELELGLMHPDGRGRSEPEMQTFIRAYQQAARRIGVTPNIDREACQYQVKCHVAPGVGYHQTRTSLDGILTESGGRQRGHGAEHGHFVGLSDRERFQADRRPEGEYGA